MIPPMSYRRLGRSGLFVYPIALGTMQFGWTADETTAQQIISKLRRGYPCLQAWGGAPLLLSHDVIEYPLGTRLPSEP